jgi:hypothetical protein
MDLRPNETLRSTSDILSNKKLLHNKGNDQQSKKITYELTENICELSIQQATNIQNL